MKIAVAALVLAAGLGCQGSRQAAGTGLGSDYSMEVAAASISALQARLDTASHNVANAHTTGFKATRVVLSEMPYSERVLDRADGSRASAAVGGGVRVAGTRLDMAQGCPMLTGRNLDIAIQGAGFFKVRQESQTNGGIAYTRAGNLSLNADGELVFANDLGQRLEPNICIPRDATSVTVGRDGIVRIQWPGQTEYSEVGQIQLTAFVQPESLNAIGDGLYVETPQSGPPLEGTPGTDARGVLLQGFLEASNVDVVREQFEVARVQSLYQTWGAMGISVRPAAVAFGR